MNEEVCANVGKYQPQDPGTFILGDVFGPLANRSIVASECNESLGVFRLLMPLETCID